jgi:hypothetical protein
MKAKIFAIITLLAFADLLPAAGETMAFLKLGAGARATGMGTAYTAVADDASAVFYNPAGIMQLKNLELLAETYVLSFGRSINFISICRPFEIGGAVYGAGLSWLNYSAGSDIEMRTTNSPDPQSEISDSTHVFMLTAAARISDRLYFGANVKVLLQLIDTSKGVGMSFDIGSLLKITEGLNFGFDVSNISGSIGWDTPAYTDNVPQAYTAGFSYSARDIFGAQKLDVILDADGTYNTGGFFRFKPGLEASANRFFFIRAGYNDGPTFGCGVKFEPTGVISVKINYAFVPDLILENNYDHRLGISIDFMPAEQGAGAPAQDKTKEKANEEKPW